MEKDLTTGNITPQLIRFTIPLVLGNIFQLMYNAIELMKLLMLDMVKMNGVREVLMRSENILVMLMVQDLDIGFPVMNVMSL